MNFCFSWARRHNCHYIFSSHGSIFHHQSLSSAYVLNHPLVTPSPPPTTSENFYPFSGALPYSLAYLESSPELKHVFIKFCVDYINLPWINSLKTWETNQWLIAIDVLSGYLTTDKNTCIRQLTDAYWIRSCLLASTGPHLHMLFTHTNTHAHTQK